MSYLRHFQSSSAPEKGWDSRFTLSQIPEYNALNDRYCKFWRKRQKNGARGSADGSWQGSQYGGRSGEVSPGRLTDGPAMAFQRPAPPGHQIPPPMLSPVEHGRERFNMTDPGMALAGPAGARLYGARNVAIEGQDILARTVGAAGSAADDLGQMTPTHPSQILTIHDFRRRQRNASRQPNAFVGGEPADQASPSAQPSPHHQPPPMSHGLVPNSDAQKMLDRRNVTVLVEKNIEIREGFLYLLQELTERAAAAGPQLNNREQLTREINQIINSLRNATLDTIETIAKWEAMQNVPNTAYLWKGVSYLVKIQSDLNFFAHSKLASLLDFSVLGNPLLARHHPHDTHARQGPGLPPVRHGKEQPGISKADPLGERYGMAEKVLQRAVEADEVEEEGYLLNLDKEDRDLLALHSQQLQEDPSVEVPEEDWLAHTQDRSKELEELAAIKIQRVYRGFRDRGFAKAKLRQQGAAVVLQKFGRQISAVNTTRRLRNWRAAAVRLQAYQRGVFARERVSAIRSERECATNIQRAYRGHIARGQARELKHSRESATKIQQLWRGYITRTDIRNSQERRHYDAAALIQKMWRGVLVRRNARFDVRKVDATVVLQAWARGLRGRGQAKAKRTRKVAVMQMQAVARGFLARQRARRVRKEKELALTDDHALTSELAAIKIQSTYRMHEGRKQAEERRSLRTQSEEALAAQLLSDNTPSRHSANYVLETEARHAAAVRIQSLVRGRQARKRTAMMRQLHKRATDLQRVERGRQARKKVAQRRAVFLQEVDQRREAAERELLEDEQRVGRKDQESNRPPVVGADLEAPEINEEQILQEAGHSIENNDDTKAAAAMDLLPPEIIPASAVPCASPLGSQGTHTPLSPPTTPPRKEEQRHVQIEAKAVSSPAAHPWRSPRNEFGLDLLFSCATIAGNEGLAVLDTARKQPPKQTKPVVRLEEKPQRDADEQNLARAERALCESAANVVQRAWWGYRSRRQSTKKREVARLARRKGETAAKEDERAYAACILQGLHLMICARARVKVMLHAQLMRRRNECERSVCAEREKAARKLQAWLKLRVGVRASVAKRRAVQQAACRKTAETARWQEKRAASVVLQRFASLVRAKNELRLRKERRDIERASLEAAARAQEETYRVLLEAEDQTERLSVGHGEAKARMLLRSVEDDAFVAFQKVYEAFACELQQEAERARMTASTAEDIIQEEPSGNTEETTPEDADGQVSTAQEDATGKVAEVQNIVDLQSSNELVQSPVANKHERPTSIDIPSPNASHTRSPPCIASEREHADDDRGVVEPASCEDEDKSQEEAPNLTRLLSISPKEAQAAQGRHILALQTTGVSPSSQVPEGAASNTEKEPSLPDKRGQDTEALVTVDRDAHSPAAKASVPDSLEGYELPTHRLSSARSDLSQQSIPALKNLFLAAEDDDCPCLEILRSCVNPEDEFPEGDRISQSSTGDNDSIEVSLLKAKELDDRHVASEQQRAVDREEATTAYINAELQKRRDDAAQTIQCKVRQVEAKKVAAEKRKVQQKRIETQWAEELCERENEAATKIQRGWTHQSAKMRAQKIKAVTRIQAFFRGVVGRRDATALKDELRATREAKSALDLQNDEAATAIQSNWRGCKAREKTSRLKQDRTEAILQPAAATIQRAERVRQAKLESDRRKIIREDERLTHVKEAREYTAACTIQRAYRCYNARFERKWRKERHHATAVGSRKNNAAIKIQKIARGLLDRRKAEQRRGDKEEAKKKALQTEKERELLEEEETAEERRREAADMERLRTENAAACIQRAYKCYNARFMLKWKRDARNKKRAGELAVEEEKLVHKSATSIQCMYRSRVARQTRRERKALRDEGKRVKSEEEIRLEKAATRIQCCYRCFNARFEAAWRRERKSAVDAAKERQKQMESMQYEQQVAEQEAERAKLKAKADAALVIQCAWRAYNARFQKRWMADQAQRKENAKKRAVSEDIAARTVQRTVRCHQARAERTRREEQKATDRQEAKQKAENEKRNRRQDAATTVQCAVRSHQARGIADKKKEERADSLHFLLNNEKRHRAAVKIQCLYRSRIAKFELEYRKMMENEEDSWDKAEEQNKAAAKLQSQYRGHAARKKVAEMKSTRKQAGEEVASEERRLKADARTAELIEKEEADAAMKIQAQWRGKQGRDEVEKKRMERAEAEMAGLGAERNQTRTSIAGEEAATKIQAATRGHQARRSISEHPLAEHDRSPEAKAQERDAAATKIQSAARGQGARRSVADLDRPIDQKAAETQEQEEAARRIQAQARKHSLHKSLHDGEDKQHEGDAQQQELDEAARKIQEHARRHSEHRSSSEKQKGLDSDENARSEAQENEEAAKKIQAQARRHSRHKSLSEQQRAAEEGGGAQAEEQEQDEAARKIQAQARRQSAHRSLSDENRARSAERDTQAEEQEQHEASLRIQAQARRQSASKAVKDLQEAKPHEASEEQLAEQEAAQAAVTVQKCYRGHATRQRVKDQTTGKRVATDIEPQESMEREAIEGHEFAGRGSVSAEKTRIESDFVRDEKAQHTAATIIQARFRGFQGRNRALELEYVRQQREYLDENDERGNLSSGASTTNTAS
ncbi:Kinesin light chain [Diplonema papillatum]|nr:Kinesin light chain [Diplonema papillatum]